MKRKPIQATPIPHRRTARRSAGRLLAAGASVLTLTGATFAQSMDYSSLEMLFGEPVTTSATGKPQRASEVPVPMEIITAEEIERTGATNIPDAIRHSMGMEVLSFSSEGRDVGVRGFNSPYNPRLLVLVNGRQVYSDHFGMTFWNTIPVQMAEIRQIEIVRGPNTALFGFNAATGVINILTYDPQYTQVNEVRVTYGTQDTKELSAVVSTPLGDKGGLTLSGSTLDADAFNVKGPNLVPDVNPETHMLSGRMSYAVGRNTEIGAELSWSETERAAFVPVFLGASPEVETFSAKTTLAHEGDLGLVKGTVYYNRLSHDTVVNGVGPLFYDNEILVAQLEDVFKVGTDHSFRVFGEFRDNTFKGDFGLSPFDERVNTSFNAYALSGMWDWSMNDALTLTTSLRYDIVDLSRSGPLVPGSGRTNDLWDQTLEEITYNAGLTWAVNPLTRVTLSAARGSKLPSLIEFGAAAIGQGPLPGTRFFFWGSPEIGPDAIESYNLAYNRSIPSIGGSAEINVFYAELKGTVTLANFLPDVVAPPNFASFSRDVGSSEEVGIEAKLEGEQDGVRWEVNYAFLDVNDDFDVFDPTGTVRVRGAEFEQGTPKHRINAHLGADLTEGLTADLYAQWTDSRRLQQLLPGFQGLELTDINDQFMLSGRVRYAVMDGVDLTLSGVGFNRTDFRPTQSERVDRQVFLTLAVSW
ncbi:TonB-dependent receptor plug domain-containing protein [Yunchengibacter salinarum]|uniref:TonB-dependent receptor plug domain-containing protein n=1 Tax=Yunchengibacter salinarum TaxID=3133399 RepID=UPI0035B5F904